MLKLFDRIGNRRLTVEAHKILACIIRIGQNYDVKMITDVLREVSSDRIRITSLARQSTFGIMKKCKRWR